MATSRLRLLRDECLVQLDHSERLSASKTLIIPDSAKRQAHELYQATVLATGPGLQRKDGKGVRPVEPQVGDKVLVYWPAFQMDAIPEYGENCRVIREGLIQGIIE